MTIKNRITQIFVIFYCIFLVVTLNKAKASGELEREKKKKKKKKKKE